MGLRPHESPPEGNERNIDRVCDLLRVHGDIVDVTIGKQPGIVVLMKQFHGKTEDTSKVLTDPAFAGKYIEHQDALYGALMDMTQLGSKDPSDNRLHVLLEGIPPPSKLSREMKEYLRMIRSIESGRQAGNPAALGHVMEVMRKDPKNIQCLMGPMRFAAQQLDTMDHTILPSEPTTTREAHAAAIREARDTMRKSPDAAALRELARKLDAGRQADHEALHAHIQSEASRFKEQDSVTIVVLGGGHISKGTHLPNATPVPLEQYFQDQTVIIMEPRQYAPLLKDALKNTETSQSPGSIARIGESILKGIRRLFGH